MGTALRQAQGPSLLVDRASDGEVELAVVVACGAKHVVEAIAPVETEQAEHRQVDTHADSCRTLHIEGVEVLEPEPAVTSLKEGQGVDGSLRIQRERVTQLQSVFRHHVTTLVGIVIITWCQRVVSITTHTDQFAAVERIVAQTVATQEETMERRGADLLVKVTQITEAHTGHHHEFLIEFSIPSRLEGPAVHLNPASYVKLCLLYLS